MFYFYQKNNVDEICVKVGLASSKFGIHSIPQAFAIFML